MQGSAIERSCNAVQTRCSVFFSSFSPAVEHTFTKYAQSACTPGQLADRQLRHHDGLSSQSMSREPIKSSKAVVQNGGSEKLIASLA